MLNLSSCFRALTTNTIVKSQLVDNTMASVKSISLEEWQSWGSDSPMPLQVSEIVEEMVDLERQLGDAQMKFGGLGGKLKVK